MKNMREERNLSALAEVRNIIAQEIYKISVVKQYPDEFLRIIKLYQNVSKKIAAASMTDESESLYRLIRELVNCVVEGQNASEFRISLLPIIDKIAEENHGKEEETANRLKKISSEVYKSNRGFKSIIPHKYPPELLIEWCEYIDIYEFFYNKNYEIKNTREKVKDDSSFMEKGEYIQVITLDLTPVTIVRPYARRLLSISNSTETIEVPIDAFSKDRTKKDFNIENPLDMKRFEVVSMASHRDISHVELTTELNFSINLQEPISQNDLDLIISRIRSRVSWEQYSNSQSLKIVASTDDEINKAFDIEKLSVSSYGENELIMSAKQPEIPDFKVALKLLAGLSLMQKTSLMLNKSSGYYTWSKRKSIKISTEIDILRLEINKKISTKKNKQVSADGVKSNYLSEGYKQVLEGINHYLELFQHKRVQFDASLNVEQRLALKVAQEINLDDLHCDDIERTKKKISAHKKHGRNASVRVRKNGSYVITW